MRRSVLLWLMLLGIVLASVALVWTRLERLPELPVLLGPDMTVRNVLVAPAPGVDAQQFQRGDHLVGLRGQAVDGLSEMLAVLNQTTAPTAPPANADGVETAPPPPPSAPGEQTLTYQIVRPLHRFNVLWQGEMPEPPGLPAGVEAQDRLVELDGRSLEGGVGPEGLRSILASRPEALLGFERRSAVFSGQLTLHQRQAPTGVLLSFALGALVLLALWRFRHSTLAAWTPLAVAAETICFVWISPLLFEYQWVIADTTLAAAVGASLVMIRPLGIFARTSSVDDGDANGRWGALGLGGAGAALILFALSGEWLPSTELVLQLAALMAAFFVVYELVLTGLSEGSGVTLGERSVYLAGVVLFLFFACLMAWYLEPVVLREERWRWFAAIVLVLVWFGDVLLCFRGMPATQFASLDSEQSRHEVIRHYLDNMSRYMGPLRLEILYHQQHGSLRLMPDAEAMLRVVPAPAPIHDAAAILIAEAASLPLPSAMDAADHPMTGIAQAMGLALAQVLSAPLHGLNAEGAQLLVLGWADVEEDPSQLWTPDFDACEQLQRKIDAEVWAACLVESWRWLAREGMPVAEPVEEEDELAALRAELDEVSGAAAMVRHDRLELATQVQALRQWYVPAPPVPEGFEGLLEEELVDALAFLAEDDGPIVLAGARGVGKTFVAACLHALEQRPEGTCTLYIPTHHAGTDHRDNILGDEERGTPGALEVCVGGTLIIEEASWLAPGELMQVVEAGRAQGTRVILCYTAEDAEEYSVLEGYPEGVAAALEAREVIIPKLSRRPAIRRAVVEHMVAQLAQIHERQISDVSPSAMSALCSFDCVGQLPQLESILDVALRRMRGDFLEIGDLPQDVRRGVI
jgi:hypothetical protein